MILVAIIFAATVLFGNKIQRRLAISHEVIEASFTYHLPVGEEYNIDWLFNISKVQRIFIMDNYRMAPQFVRMNPCFIRDPYQEDRVIVTYRIVEKSGKHDKAGYIWLNLMNNTVTKSEDWIELMKPNQDNRQLLFGQDVRMFLWNGVLHLLYNIHHARYKEILFGPLRFDKEVNVFYVEYPSTHLSIDHEVGGRHQKNWSPFEYCPGCSFRNGFVSLEYVNRSLQAYGGGRWSHELGPSTLLFIYSIQPHRVVSISPSNITSDRHPKVWQAHTLSETTIENNFWVWGEMRGGSPAVRINESHYLTFFHSSGMFNHRHILSYFMGAYLFQAHPPFAITSMTSAPIVHEKSYNESFGGWAYKAVDYVQFPMGIIFDSEVVNVSYGRNDANGWIISLNRTEFLESLKPVRTRVVGDSQWSSDKKSFAPKSFTKS